MVPAKRDEVNRAERARGAHDNPAVALQGLPYQAFTSRAALLTGHSV
jgi:hypothetical protein